jgi:hypothetical protein
MPALQRQGRGAHAGHGLRPDTDLVAAALVVRGHVIGPVQVHVPRPLGVARLAREKQRLLADRTARGIVAQGAQAPGEHLPGRRGDFRVRTGERRF